MPLDLKYAERSLSPKSTDFIVLIAQVPRSQDMVIFVLTTTTTLPITLPFAGGIIIIINLCLYDNVTPLI